MMIWILALSFLVTIGKIKGYCIFTTYKYLSRKVNRIFQPMGSTALLLEAFTPTQQTLLAPPTSTATGGHLTRSLALQA